jgi:hypothetical protein
MNRPEFANFVIGGTEKSGTTSVFDWLTAHPEVGGSSRKETNFFREGWTGDLDSDARRYGAFFEHCHRQVPIRVEASPAYLGDAATVAPRMRRLAPDMKVLFILRDPIARLYSSYHFCRSKFFLPQELSFDEYVDRCFAFDQRLQGARQLGLDEWFLKALRIGCYSEFIATFRDELSPGQVKVMFFESLREDACAFMVELSAFLPIEPGFWSGHEFSKSNVTFSARIRCLHELASRTNAAVEPVMRRYPALKKKIVKTYKALNQEREGYDALPPRTRARLAQFYAPSIRALERDLGVRLPDEWEAGPQGARPRR